ncbi:MAG TPA: PKD domain-containing protein [Candidatus Eisenbacteria bacterium]|nr:PKD domain-containing protein [Candidatus Eisenbacteria bacterium]
MRNRAFLKVALLGLLTLAFAPGYALAAGQGQDLSEMLASSAAVHATAVSGPIITVNPLSLNFGVVNVGNSATLPITISNTGDETLIISANNYSDPSFTTGGGMILSLSPGASANQDIFFNPTDGNTHSGTLTIESNASNGNLVISLSGQGNAAPTLDPIGDQVATAFVNLSFTVTASDADDTNDDIVTLTMGPGLPPGATFNAGTGQFSWTPTDADGGPHTVTFTASDGLLSDSETITIDVTVGNRPPVADAGGPYSAIVGQQINFDGTGSSDPDAGQTLSYSWDFGDGSSASGATAAHAYGIPGTFLVSLEVCDNGGPQLCASDVASAIISTEVAASIVLKNNGSTIRTHGGGKELVGIELPLYPLTSVDVSSIRMSTDYPGAGSVSEIAAQTKGAKIGDLDLDQVPDLDVFFTRADIAALLGNVPNNTVINIRVTGNIVSTSGNQAFAGTKSITVKAGGGAVTASAYPNPFNPETSIAYTTRISGPVTLKIYSIDGRLVRTLKEGEHSTAGTHEVRWNGIDNAGRHVPSGVYFVRTSVLSETSVFKLAITK